MQAAATRYIASPRPLRLALRITLDVLSALGYLLLATYETLVRGKSVNEQIGRDQEELGR